MDLLLIVDLSWYNSLNKPLFTPPPWVFTSSWIIIYILMGISGFLVFRKGIKGNSGNEAIRFFSFQLLLNSIWEPVFFLGHQILLALFVVIFLWYFVYRTIKIFEKIDRTASYLLYPYLGCVTFASILNLSILIMNR